MTARAVRLVVIAVCGAGIAGMIAASVAGNNGVALTFGLLSASAVVCLIVATAVTHPAGAATTAPDEARAQEVEQLVERLVADGADENEIRRLVGEAVRLGRGR